MKKKKSVSLERVKQAVKIRKYIPEMTPKEIKCGFKITDDEQRLESEIENGNWKPVSQKETNRLRLEMSKAKGVVTKTASELAEVLGLSPADGVLIELRSDLNNKIISVVKSRNLTHARLAKLAQAPPITITALMNRNASNISTDLMVRILTSLGIRVKLQFKMVDAHKEVISSHFFTVKQLDEMIQKKFPKGISAPEKIKALRIREGLTQKMLAEKSQIAQQNISEIERGERAVGVQTAKKLSVVLNCDYRSIL
jgi:transcriptional regulator with XRE-family HTH domain